MSIDSIDMRIQELAAGFSLGDLSEAEMHEIKSYDPKILQDMIERSEDAAARAFLTFQNTMPTEAIPADLSDRLKKMASGFILDAEKSAVTNPIPVVTALPSNETSSSVNLREMTAWLCMAASIAIALCVWLPARRVEIASLQSQRDKFVSSTADMVRTNWELPAPDATKGTDLGEVVWSTEAQQGFMTFRGLPVNDPTKEQYQLWIIDPSRDEKPVDGGVFDIASAGESIVPIRAKLRVDKPTVFAITVEKPGGVVVSDQKRLPLLAKLN
jgi:Anti-sigma-K factor rskA